MDTLGIFQGSGLGEAGQYPWREYSEETEKLQEATNVSLRRFGYAPISADGYLGPATCGARKTLQSTHIPEMKWPDTCEEFTAPHKAAAAAPLPTTMPSAAAPMAYRQPSGFSWASVIAIGSGLAVAVGVVFVGKKRGWF